MDLTKILEADHRAAEKLIEQIKKKEGAERQPLIDVPAPEQLSRRQAAQLARRVWGPLARRKIRAGGVRASARVDQGVTRQPQQPAPLLPLGVAQLERETIQFRRPVERQALRRLLRRP